MRNGWRIFAAVAVLVMLAFVGLQSRPTTSHAQCFGHYSDYSSLIRDEAEALSNNDPATAERLRDYSQMSLAALYGQGCCPRYQDSCPLWAFPIAASDYTARYEPRRHELIRRIGNAEGLVTLDRPEGSEPPIPMGSERWWMNVRRFFGDAQSAQRSASVAHFEILVLNIRREMRIANDQFDYTYAGVVVEALRGEARTAIEDLVERRINRDAPALWDALVRDGQSLNIGPGDGDPGNYETWPAIEGLDDPALETYRRDLAATYSIGRQTGYSGGSSVSF